MARSDRGSSLSAPGRPTTPGGNSRPSPVKTSESGVEFVDYKDTETLRRLISSNGKLHGRKRNGVSAMHQRMITKAIKRARFMALLPYVEANV